MVIYYSTTSNPNLQQIPARTGHARFSDPQTSHDAANNVDAGKLERLVVGCIREHGPIASDRVSQILGIDLQSVSPRFRPLANRGLIRQHMVNGNPATVKSLTSNRQRMMWVGCAEKEIDAEIV